MTAMERSGKDFRGLIPILLFIFGLSAFAFAYGVLVGVYRYFPYDILHDAGMAADAVREKYSMSPEPHAYVVDHDKAGVTVYNPAKAFNGYTFLTAYRGGQHKAILIDMRGDILHEWSTQFSDVWPQAPHVIDQADDAAIHWHGSHLFSNGDVLFNFESGQFPYGGGLVKIDKDSNVLWSLERNTHHDVEVIEDGTIYVPAHYFRSEPVGDAGNLKPPYLEDVILEVSPGGHVLSELSILDALQKSEYKNLISMKYGSDSQEDPTHLNTVDVLSEGLSNRFPMFEPGDLLISLRNLNMIGVIDAEDRFVKWALVGMFVRQHDPDFLDNGHIMLFDNLGGRETGKHSQILEIDPVTQEVVWRYTGSKEDRFFSEIRGKQQALPNGNVLITDSQSGRLLEVTGGEPPEIVWEYYNGISPIDGEHRVGLITLARRLEPEAANFLN